MDALSTMLQAIARDPGDDTAWLALSDCLEEEGRPERAELVRVQLELRRQPEAHDRAGNEDRQRHLWYRGIEPCTPTIQGPLGINFLLIPPGSFFMGALSGEQWMDEDELPRRKVTLTRGFYLGVTQITQAQWQALMGENPSHGRGDDRPVERVSWHECREFCARLTSRINRLCRLPSEAEWEYACRAGTSTPYCSGADVTALRQVGWCSYSGEWDSSSGTRAVAQLRPNAFGLYDMHGNVWEWCQDYYDSTFYSRGPAVDPIGISAHGGRVVRGGSWRGGPWFCRSAERRSVGPGAHEINIGLRIALPLE